MELEVEYEDKLDSDKLAKITPEFHLLGTKEQYELLKDLLIGTKLSKFFDNKCLIADIEQKRDFENGFFLCTRVGENLSQYISFVVKNEELVFSIDHYVHNYSGYQCYCTPDLIIHENIGHGFGSWTYRTYDLDGNLLSERSERNIGCCCD